jgi:hypothetical protein
MNNILTSTATCPAWCTAHDGQMHNTFAHVPGFDLNMSQVGHGPGVVLV